MLIWRFNRRQLPANLDNVLDGALETQLDPFRRSAGKRLRFLPMRRFCTGLTGQPRLYSFCYSLKKRCPYTPVWRPVQTDFCRSFHVKFRPEKAVLPIFNRLDRPVFSLFIWAKQPSFNRVFRACGRSIRRPRLTAPFSTAKSTAAFKAQPTQAPAVDRASVGR